MLFMIYFLVFLELRRMFRVDKGIRIEIERELLYKVEFIREDECVVVDFLICVVNEGEKILVEGIDGEMNDEKIEGDKIEDGDKIKEDSNKDKKIWMEYVDFCKCFRLGNFIVCFCINSYIFFYGFILVIFRIKLYCIL